MKILLDLQACQSETSRNRGIGRYSMALAQALIRNAPQHECWLLLNGAFPEAAAAITTAFQASVPAHRIAVFHPPAGITDGTDPQHWSVLASELIRRHAIRAVKPDVVHVASLFEGVSCATRIGPADDSVATVVTLYDLIPLLNAKHYLADPRTNAHYMGKLDSLCRADLVLGISESACAEARKLERLSANTIVNISSAGNADLFFTDGPRLTLPEMGLSRPFVMYTGGIDWRKNLEGLIRAFALLPKALRSTYQLALVCHADTDAQQSLRNIVAAAGLEQSDVVITGYVSDFDLARLYRSCTLFVFPSLHEGFGLPALEAMMCGAPALGSNTSSIPEVIGRADALFDPVSPKSIAELMARALSDAEFRTSLTAHAATQSGCFSWDQTAQRAWSAIEDLHAARQTRRTHKAPASKPTRPSLALVTPLPPAQSGIADYCADLIPQLSNSYDITLVCDQHEVRLPGPSQNLPVRTSAWFRAHASEFDRVVYQFGNSEFHASMFALLEAIRGVVVLHDFQLGGVLNWLDTDGGQPGVFAKALAYSHGQKGVAFAAQKGRFEAMDVYPLNRFVIERATGVIVHSRYAINTAAHWYGSECSAHWHCVPLLRALPTSPDRAAARAELGLGPEDYLVCSFGHIVPTKLNHRLLAAWAMSALKHDPRARLVFVGGDGATPYGDAFRSTVAQQRPAGQVSITGYAPRALFDCYLAAADVAVQLRSPGRGETSGALLDCLAHGVPVIANASGPTAEYPATVMQLLPEVFSDAQLAAALDGLHQAPLERKRLAKCGVEWVAQNHDPGTIAAQYHAAIETSADHPHAQAYWDLIDDIARLDSRHDSDDLVRCAQAIAASFAVGTPLASR